MVIGIPQGLLYHRERVLWLRFFQALGLETVLSGPTDRAVLERGTALAIDEACLSLKVYLGHVDALIGRCDCILAPRISGYGWRRCMCTRFEALPDLVRNIFRDRAPRILSYNVDVPAGQDEPAAFAALGRSLGCPPAAVKRAYGQAVRAAQADFRARVQRQEAAWRQPGLKLLLAGHSYLLEDPYLGRPIAGYLQAAGAVPLRADLTDRETALRRSSALSPTCKWELNREILGGIVQYRDRADGIILVSAFPCGPDAMVNELILRRVRGVPMLHLVLDGQTGTAGVETRLESFLDIIRLREGTL